MKRQLREEWTGEVVGKLHVLNSTQIELAMVCGYAPEYLCSVLNGKKKFCSEYAKNRTKRKIFRSLKILEERIRLESNEHKD